MAVKMAAWLNFSFYIALKIANVKTSPKNSDLSYVSSMSPIWTVQINRNKNMIERTPPRTELCNFWWYVLKPKILKTLSTGCMILVQHFRFMPLRAILSNQ